MSKLKIKQLDLKKDLMEYLVSDFIKSLKSPVLPAPYWEELSDGIQIAVGFNGKSDKYRIDYEVFKGAILRSCDRPLEVITFIGELTPEAFNHFSQLAYLRAAQEFFEAKMEEAIKDQICFGVNEGLQHQLTFYRKIAIEALLKIKILVFSSDKPRRDKDEFKGATGLARVAGIKDLLAINEFLRFEERGCMA